MDLHCRYGLHAYPPSHPVLTALERGIRLNEAVRKGDLYNDAEIYQFPFYTFLYYARYIPGHPDT